MNSADEKDLHMSALLRATAQALSEEDSDFGFVLIMGRSAEDGAGTLLSISNLCDEDTTHILEVVLDRRRKISGQNAQTTKTVQ